MPDPLRLESIRLTYGSVHAVDDVSLVLQAGERHALIGPNGAGKSTLLGVISGRLEQTSGRVLLEGTDVSRASEHRRARLGIGKASQHSSVFLGLSVQDNVLLSAQRALGLAARPLRSVTRYAHLYDHVAGSLSAVGLQDRAGEPASALSHGERRQLELAIALAGQPRLLLLDEPTAGMSAAESAAFVRLVKALPEHITVLLIEHDLDVVFELATTLSVLHLGKLIASGPPEEVRMSEAVQEAYLGAMRADDLFESEELS